MPPPHHLTSTDTNTPHIKLRRLKEMKESYQYQGTDTCAADGMCQEKCPVKINTGDLIKAIRAEEMKHAPGASATAK